MLVLEDSEFFNNVLKEFLKEREISRLKKLFATYGQPFLDLMERIHRSHGESLFINFFRILNATEVLFEEGAEGFLKDLNDKFLLRAFDWAASSFHYPGYTRSFFESLELCNALIPIKPNKGYTNYSKMGSSRLHVGKTAPFFITEEELESRFNIPQGLFALTESLNYQVTLTALSIRFGNKHVEDVFAHISESEHFCSPFVLLQFLKFWEELDLESLPADWAISSGMVQVKPVSSQQLRESDTLASIC